MKKLLIILWDAFALRSMCSIFENDAHNIVSKKGWKILNK